MQTPKQPLRQWSHTLATLFAARLAKSDELEAENVAALGEFFRDVDVVGLAVQSPIEMLAQGILNAILLGNDLEPCTSTSIKACDTRVKKQPLRCNAKGSTHPGRHHGHHHNVPSRPERGHLDVGSPHQDYLQASADVI